MPNFSRIAAPLNALTKKNVVFSWSAECCEAFQVLDNPLSTAPVLALPDLSKPYKVITGASGFALGAVLQQDGRSIALASRRMQPAERNYHPGEQEPLAAIFALRQWRCYLEGAEFVLVTDHHPNKFLPTKQDLSGRQAEWVDYLQRFQFTWRYHPGKNNVADPLRRSPALEPKEVLACCLHLAPCWQCDAQKLYALLHPQQLPCDSQVAELCAAVQKLHPAHCRQLGGPEEVPLGSNLRSTKTLHAPKQHQSDPVSTLEAHSPQDRRSVLQRIKEGYDHDAWFMGTQRKGNKPNTVALLQDGGAWYTAKQLLDGKRVPHRIVVPNAPGLRQLVLSELHGAPCSGHTGVTQTQQALNHMFWWPTCQADVRTFVTTCASCQRVQLRKTKTPGLLQPLQVPTRTWSSIRMDFITQLPVTRSGMDAIVVFVDCLTKMTRFAACNTTVTAEQTAQLFFENVYRSHGLPEGDVSDRDPRFTSVFTEELYKRMGTKQAMSTAYHPQSNGQSA